MSAKNVEIIEPKNSNNSKPKELKTLKVAAYARVSTELDEQQSSYEAQIKYFTEYISSHPGWKLVKVYADEGITGTNMNKREGFKQMIADAEAGKIDLILTKSISRFARNVVDALDTIRKLQAQNVYIYFEKENLKTDDPKSETLLAMMSSLAQEESRSISENVRWSIERNMKKGKVKFPYIMLGYKKGADGKPEIVEEEAKIIRWIFNTYLGGMSANSIAKILNEKGVKLANKGKKWESNTVNRILANEKYAGNALLQKTYTEDFLTKKVKRNKGERRQYFVHNNHPAIIDQTTFDLVQIELKIRSENKRTIRCDSVFASKIKCEDCGSYYGRKLQNAYDGKKVYAWFCNHRYQNEKKCSTPSIRDDVLQAMSLDILNQIIGNKRQHTSDAKQKIEILKKQMRETKSEIEKLDDQINNIIKDLNKMIELNKRQIQDQTLYMQRYNRKVEKAQKLSDQKDQLITDNEARLKQINGMQGLVNCLRGAEPLTEFSGEVFARLVDHISVSAENIATYHLRDQREILMDTEVARENWKQKAKDSLSA